MKKQGYVGIALTAVVLLAAGCRQQGNSAATNAPARSSAQSLQIKGSDTMVNLAQAWAEAYMKKHPETSVAVTGGGSGTGIAALLNGTTDIATASREMKPAEFAQAKQKGFEIAEKTVALDAVTVIVNPANPVKKLTTAQLSDIYTGKVTNWKQVGGPDRKIVTLSRDKNSGTHVFFLEHVLRGGKAKGPEQYAAGVLMLPSSQAIADEVASNADAIGYIGLGYLKPGRHQAVAVAAKAGGAYVAPSAETVRSAKYPIARPLHLYMRKPVGETATDFIAFAHGPAGQQIVSKQEFVALTAGE
ncbi:MAG TPA: phosphate ABC transporter substrate-binding protein [Armatimonadota bacterium]|nr:phosphate ABC transporter substrate-binding protein [Armatimonadota bacterium]